MARRPRSYWEQLIADYEASEQTQQAFCDEHEVSLSTFQYWLYRMRRQRDDGNVAPIDGADESVWATLYEQTPCSLSLIDREHRIVAANARFREIFGEWEGLYCFEVFKREHRPCGGCGLAKAFADGKVHFAQERGVDKRGRSVAYEVTAAPIRRKGADEVEYVLEMCVDITRLKDLERRYETLFERAPCHIAVIDRLMRVVQTNLRYRERFGDTRGRPCHEVLAHAGHRCEDCPVERVFVDARVHATTLPGSAGQPELLVHAAPLVSQGGEVLQVLEMAIEVTPQAAATPHTPHPTESRPAGDDALAELDEGVAELSAARQSGEAEAHDRAIERLRRAVERAAGSGPCNESGTMEDTGDSG